MSEQNQEAALQQKLTPQPGPVQFDCEVAEMADKDGSVKSIVRLNIRTISGETSIFLPPEGVEVMVNMLTEALQFAKTGLVQANDAKGLIIPMNGHKG